MLLFFIVGKGLMQRTGRFATVMSLSFKLGRCHTCFFVHDLAFVSLFCGIFLMW